ncbi:MAG: hypothetical protein HY669_03305 [Chloroflexi bacterium]|nr:hypothetical protein [Chloroflexota bacterium]
MKCRGDILRIDLSTQSVSRDPITPELFRRFLGGEGLNSWLLWEHLLKVGPRIDPLSADNVLIAGIGPLGGTGYGVGTKMKWTFKSPITNMFGDSVSGGFFPGQLRWAGYEHLVVTGKAKQPVYIWIDNDRVEIRDASHLWGKSVAEADRLIKEELGDRDIETAGIGRAGENLVTYSCLSVSRTSAAGRAGGGCVMGSKNLKAIAVRGGDGIDIYDPAAFREAIDTLLATMRSESVGGLYGWSDTDGRKKYGTLILTETCDNRGYSAVRNNQGDLLTPESREKLSHNLYTNKMALGAHACSPGCVRGCVGWYRARGNESPAASRYATVTGHKPEYSAIAAFGVMCDIPDMPAVGHFNGMCDEYSIDVIEAGAVCAFLMELWQRGVVTREDTADWFGEPVSLEWGNYEAVEKMLNSMALQNNKLGRLVKDGVYKAAHRIEEMKNVPVLKYAIYGKGGAAFICDPRFFVSSAVNYAVAARGCDHLKGAGTLDKVNRPEISQLYFGTPDGAKPFSTKLKGASSAVQENRIAVINCLGVCRSLVGDDPFLYSMELFGKALHAATGVSLTPEELWAAGERTVNLEKAINSRMGYRREDDRICERWMKEPVPEGPGKGWKAEDYLEQAKDEYYEYKGWDKKTSLQTEKKLRELGLDDVARVLKEDGAVV